MTDKKPDNKNPTESNPATFESNQENQFTKKLIVNYDTNIKAGQSPGSLTHVGEKKVLKTEKQVIDFDETSLEEKDITSLDEIPQYKNKNSISWINIVGLHDENIIEQIGNVYSIHSLVLEDILNTGQRPKAEEYDDYIFIVAKMVFYDDENNEMIIEHFSLILAKNSVLTFQEIRRDVFNPIRERIRQSGGRVRRRGEDYLSYVLLDTLVDSYFLVLDKLNERIAVLEDEVINKPSKNTLVEIYKLRRDLLDLSTNIRPLREVIDAIEDSESELIDESTNIFFRDLHDHVIEVNVSIHNFREMAAGLLDSYLSMTSNKMNEVMKVLTIMASIFIPLTFICGVYGMNFVNMPELDWHLAYPVVLTIMLSIAGGMLYLFKRKGWF